jgi:hypothetical protein
MRLKVTATKNNLHQSYQRMKMQKENLSLVTGHLADLLRKGNAHVSLDETLDNVPFELLAKTLPGLPYSIWQITEHIRITQWDMLEFSSSPSHVSPKWPDGYWPEDASPNTENHWINCVAAIKQDREEFIELLRNSGENLYTPFPWGTGQSLFKEALVIADHNSYHTGEIIILRRLLNNWR